MFGLTAHCISVFFLHFQPLDAVFCSPSVLAIVLDASPVDIGVYVIGLQCKEELVRALTCQDSPRSRAISARVAQTSGQKKTKTDYLDGKTCIHVAKPRSTVAEFNDVGPSALCS